MSASAIEWTDVTWNPVRGCSMAPGSEAGGCLNCYAARMASRNLPEMRSPTTGKAFARRTAKGPRWTGAVELIPSKLDEPLHWRKPRRVFVNSMSDLFHEALPAEDVAEVFRVMARCPQHTFQILTKRPGRMLELVPRVVATWGILPNVWLGVSVEDQATADARIPLLLQTPAAKRFVSYEPALGPVDFGRYYFTTLPGREAREYPFPQLDEEDRTKWLDLLDWIIVGGESGPGARPFNSQWARSTVFQCRDTKTACFVKQMGCNILDRNDRLATDNPAPWPDLWPEPESGWDDGARGNLEHLDDGYQGAPVRIRLKSSKGGDMAEWPEDLRVREFPA